MNKYRNGKIVYVNLTEASFEIKDVPQKIREKYVGGKGLATWLLYNSTSEKIDPLTPENPVIFAGGPLTGTIAPSMRGVVVSCSPLTGGYVDSYYGGHFAQELRYAGYDALVITGKAKNPVFIHIENEKIKILSAEEYWGLDTFETNKKLKKELADTTVKIASIGPAGENLVPFALVSCEYNRQAGRGGIGAVMGSKNLKAVVLEGTRLLSVADRKGFLNAVSEAQQELKKEPAIEELSKSGTPPSLWFANREGLLPVKNYQKGTFDPKGLAEEAQRKEIWLRDVGCAACPISCSKIGVIRQGKRKGIISDVVEYETAALMGANLEIDNIKEVAYLVYLCDALGLDGMSAGSIMGFTMECFEEGILDSRNYEGLEISFGSSKNVDKVLEQIALKNGPLGQLLAKGTKKASEELGEEAIKRAVHVKGMDVPAWGPRGVPAMGLAYLTACRGACHQRAFPLTYEIEGEYKGNKIERLAVKGKARMVIDDQNYLAALDTFIKCDFGTFGISPQTYIKLFQTATGEKMDKERLFELGERIWNLSRLFNLRQGISYKDETLPKRFYEPLPDGPARGHRFTEKDEEIMLQEYYRERGWDNKGHPTAKKLNELNIIIKE